MDHPSAPSAPSIEPLLAGERPFWSVMIPTDNGDPHLADAIASVLEQDPGPERMQIEVVDDCSTHGDPEKLVAQVGDGRAPCTPRRRCRRMSRRGRRMQRRRWASGKPW
jgi:GT2 family glycosyltransferase